MGGLPSAEFEETKVLGAGKDKICLTAEGEIETKKHDMEFDTG
jgi:hypothetical protein